MKTRKTRNNRFLAILSAALAMALSCLPDEYGHHLNVGDPLPEFSTHTLDNRNAGTAELLGKPSLVVLFSTTCPDCHRQLPEVQGLHEDFGDRINILAVARSEGEDIVRKYIELMGYTFPVSAPGNTAIYDLFDNGSMSGVPQLYGSDSAGTIVFYADDSETVTEAKMASLLLENQQND